MQYKDRTFFIDHFHEAVKKGHIQPYFQPLFRSVTGKTIGAEALARWIDPDHGSYLPADFIPALEQSGLIYELDMEMLRHTCAFYRDLYRRGTPLHFISVNLSRHDFRNGDLFETVTDTLKRYDVPREAIKLEITESLMMEDIDAFQRVFRQFHDAGFSIWLDDFGSGYSSLNVLQNYSFDLIKFDMLFLRNFTKRGRQLLASLVNMAKTLCIHTLTEGVETKEHRDFLLDIGCEVQQGFYYTKPLSTEDLLRMIDEQDIILEKPEDRNYWNQIGRLNYLSLNPLEEFSYSTGSDGMEDQTADDTGVPLALLECSQDRTKYAYASSSYLRCIRDLGYRSLEELEETFNNHRSDQYLMLKKLVTDSIVKDSVQVVEYINNDVYYKLSARCLIREKNRAMLALYLSTFDSEREVKTAREMLNYGNALFSTYELAVLIYPERNLSTRIYSAQNLPVYDREGSLKRSVEVFCESEVDPLDRERYLRFMDFSGMSGRIEESSKRFIQSYFRMQWKDDASKWHTVRVTQIPASAEKAYLLTIQSVQGEGTHWLDVIAREHPEMLD